MLDAVQEYRDQSGQDYSGQFTLSAEELEELQLCLMVEEQNYHEDGKPYVYAPFIGWC